MVLANYGQYLVWQKAAAQNVEKGGCGGMPVPGDDDDNFPGLAVQEIESHQQTAKAGGVGCEGLGKGSQGFCSPGRVGAVRSERTHAQQIKCGNSIA